MAGWRTQGVAFCVSLLPCLLLVGAGLPSLDLPAALASGGGEADTSLLISWVLWLYSGFSYLGSIAGEVERPRHTYPLAVALLLPLVTTSATHSALLPCETRPCRLSDEHPV